MQTAPFVKEQSGNSWAARFQKWLTEGRDEDRSHRTHQWWNSPNPLSGFLLPLETQERQQTWRRWTGAPCLVPITPSNSHERFYPCQANLSTLPSFFLTSFLFSSLPSFLPYFFLSFHSHSRFSPIINGQFLIPPSLSPTPQSCTLRQSVTILRNLPYRSSLSNFLSLANNGKRKTRTLLIWFKWQFYHFY